MLLPTLALLINQEESEKKLSLVDILRFLLVGWTIILFKIFFSGQTQENKAKKWDFPQSM